MFQFCLGEIIAVHSKNHTNNFGIVEGFNGHVAQLRLLGVATGQRMREQTAVVRHSSVRPNERLRQKPKGKRCSSTDQNRDHDCNVMTLRRLLTEQRLPVARSNLI
jgi:hypothetical protein